MALFHRINTKAKNKDLENWKELKLSREQELQLKFIQKE